VRPGRRGGRGTVDDYMAEGEEQDSVLLGYFKKPCIGGQMGGLTWRLRGEIRRICTATSGDSQSGESIEETGRPEEIILEKHGDVQKWGVGRLKNVSGEDLTERR